MWHLLQNQPQNKCRSRCKHCGRSVHRHVDCPKKIQEEKSKGHRRSKSTDRRRKREQSPHPKRRNRARRASSEDPNTSQDSFRESSAEYNKDSEKDDRHRNRDNICEEIFRFDQNPILTSPQTARRQDEVCSLFLMINCFLNLCLKFSLRSDLCVSSCAPVAGWAPPWGRQTSVRKHRDKSKEIN